MKHTPGPWKWNPIGECWLEGTDGSTIIHVDPYGNTIPDRDDANGRLIEAAPELLNSAEEAVELFELISKFAGGELSRITAWRQKTEAAIRHVRG